MAAILPGRIEYFRYDWRREGGWNLAFALGIVAGGFLAGNLLANPEPVGITGVADLQPASFLALIGFFAGGIAATFLVLPWLLGSGT